MAKHGPRPVVNPAALVVCPECGGTFPVLRDEDNRQVVVQPFPVSAVAPFRGLIHESNPVPPALALKKCLEGTMSVREMPPVFVPHAYCCPGVEGVPVLFRQLPPTQGENQDDAEGNNPESPQTVEDNQPHGGHGHVRVHEIGGEDR